MELGCWSWSWGTIFERSVEMVAHLTFFLVLLKQDLVRPTGHLTNHFRRR
jgi:hypothetical protein